MARTSVKLPEGFVLDEPNLPDGFVLDEADEFQPFVPEPFADPNDVEVRDRKVLDLADETGVPFGVADKSYEPLKRLIDAVPDPKDIILEDVVVPSGKEVQPTLATAEEKKSFVERLFGFRYPPKPPNWNFASPIERFNYIMLPLSDFLGRLGGKITSDWRITTKKEAQKILAGDYNESLEWYQKSPEMIGWTAKKVAEFLLLKSIFKLSGLHKVLSAAGQKATKPFLSKALIARGGMQQLKTLSSAGLRNITRQALTSFLQATPENIAFISSWSALDAVMKGKSPKEVGIAALKGAGWGLALTAGMSVIAPIARAPEIKLAFTKAMQNLGQKYPKIIDLLGKNVPKEIEAEWLKQYGIYKGRDIRLIDLTTRQRAQFRNAVRAVEKELIKAAKTEQALRTYWATEMRTQAEAAKAAAKVAKEKAAIEKPKPPTEVAEKPPEAPPKAITPEIPPTVPAEAKELPSVEKTKEVMFDGTLYHNTTIESAQEIITKGFTVQDTSKMPKQERGFVIGNLGDGIYLSPDFYENQNTAAKMGIGGDANIVVRPKRPLRLYNLGDKEGAASISLELADSIKQQGYDGIIVNDPHPQSGGYQVIVFDPKNIKAEAVVEEADITPEQLAKIDVSLVAPTPAKPEVAEKPAEVKPKATITEIAKEHEAEYEIVKRKSEEQGLLALSDDEFETLIAKEDFVPEEYKREAGFVAVPDFGVVSDMYNRAHDWMITFGEAKRIHPELYDKLMKSYGQRGAGVEKAIDEVGRILEEPLSLEEDAELALTYEDKRLKPPEELKDVYDKFSTLLDRLEKIQLKEGIFQRPFQERMIEENQVKIEQLSATLKHPTQSKQIQALVAENEELKNMRYLSHNVVARRAIEAKVNRLKGDERKAFLSRMSYIYRKRKGKLFLKDYLDTGLITKEDIRMTRLATQELSDYYVRSSYKTLYDYGKAEGLIKPTSSELRAEGWLNQKELGIIAPELKEQLIHPLYGSALAELKTMRLRTGGFGQQILSMTKIGQFIKPSIIWTYNAVQKYMRGMYSFDPIKESKLLAQATREVLSKSPLYHKLNADNLYQFPYEVSKGSRKKQIDLFIRQNSKEISRLLKLLEKTTDMSWAPEDMDLGQLTKNMMIAAHKAVAQVTWTGDKIQRTQSYLILRDMGYPHDEAIKVASKSHGAYSVLSERYKKIASKLLFVYSFRFLMPIEIGKILTEPVKESVQAFLKKEKIPAYKAKRWAKAWIGAVALPIMIDQYMKYRGFEKEGVHLGPYAWKWKKEVIVKGKKSEIVVGMNYILNMPVKYAQRLMYYNPIRPETRTQQVLENIAKWEIHPLYRIFFWDINENRRSFGAGIEVYDTEANSAIQLGQITKYIIGQSFRFWGGMMDAIGEGEMTEKERVEQEKIFDSALTDLDKFLFTVLGYKYTRQNLKDRQVIMAKYLEKELASRRFNIERKYEGKEKKRRIDSLKQWVEKCRHWILNEMK